MLPQSHVYWKVGYIYSVNHCRNYLPCGIRRFCTDKPSTSKIKKKDLSSPFPSKYEPSEVESGWYEWWEQNGFFRRTGAKEKFVMILPPPNVTGTLHLGHALTCSVQDVIARWHQMRGAEVVFVPGSDHAGIATQVVVEKHLLEKHNTTRHQLGRERFIEEVWKWKEEKGNKIYEQMKRLGTSLDWPRAVFTLDKAMSNAVTEAFVQLHQSGLIYRKPAMINWCCSLQSAISDIEVEHIHLTGPTDLKVPGYKEPVTFGKMYDFAYKVVGSDEELIVSTTRPETMLGDSAVIVHPDDPRYKHLLGRNVFHPFRQEQIPIIGDDTVDPDFGTGAVKVTPGHSKNDYDIGLRLDLQQISIFDDHGLMSDLISEFKGVPRFEARTIIIETLKSMGLFRGCHSHPMMLPLCSRTNDIIEHMLRPQWFISCSTMAKTAIEAVRTGELQIHPEMHRRTWLEWLESGREWCVSRQLWWGHRIPAYCIHWRDGAQTWEVARSEDDARKSACDKNKRQQSDIASITQDEDVMDTWFSSGLYPFVVFGWPQDTSEMREYYPSTLLETGHDILFFWVARMVMLAQKLTGELPFKTVLLHGLMCDAQGHKMSKSRGNIVNPLHIIEGTSPKEAAGDLTSEQKLLKKGGNSNINDIPECGADALRYTLCSTNFQNQLLSVDVHNAVQHRFMVNKIWQSVRFLVNVIGDNAKVTTRVLPKQRDDLALMDRWILSQLSGLVSGVNRHFETYDLHQATLKFTNFWYNDLCSTYLESIKPRTKNRTQDCDAALQTLWTVIDVGLHILSPFMPYVTEELYHRLPRTEPCHQSIIQCSYPQPSEWSMWKDSKVDELVDGINQVTSSFRSLSLQYKISGKDAQGSIVTRDALLYEVLMENKDMLENLGRISEVDVSMAPARPPPASVVSVISDTTSVYLHIKNLDHYNCMKQIVKLEKKMAALKKEMKYLSKLVSSAKYAKKTSPQQKEMDSERMSTIVKELVQINNLISGLQKT